MIYDGSAVSLFPSAGPAARSSNKVFFTTDVSPNRKRILIFGLNRNPLTDGSIADIAVSASRAVPGGATEIVITEMQASFADGTTTPLTNTTSYLALSPDPSQPLNPPGVWNAASLQASAVSAGALMTLRGAGIGPIQSAVPQSAVTETALGGVSVTFDGLPAPMLYASSDQLNVIAPWALVSQSATQIVVWKNGAAAYSVSVPVAAATPAIFTLSSNGTGGGAILNQDASVNSPLNPADAGSIISLYGTGLGPTIPAGTDGAIMGATETDTAVSVMIGGLPAPVLYAGAAPGLVSGAFQINCRVPQGLTGLAVEVVVQAGNAQSVLGVTVAIK